MVSGSFPGERNFLFPDCHGVFVLVSCALLNLGRVAGHPPFVLTFS